MAPNNSQPSVLEQNSIPIAESSKAISKPKETKSMILCDKKELLNFLDSISSKIKQINTNSNVKSTKNEETQTESVPKEQRERSSSVASNVTVASTNEPSSSKNPVRKYQTIRFSRNCHPGLEKEFLNWYQNETNQVSFEKIRLKLIEIHDRKCKHVRDCSFTRYHSLEKWWDNFNIKYRIAKEQQNDLIGCIDRLIEYFHRTQKREAHKLMAQERRKLCTINFE